MWYCIENKHRDRIFVGPHWETKPVTEQVLVFQTYLDAEHFTKQLPDDDLVICEVMWQPSNPKVWTKMNS